MNQVNIETLYNSNNEHTDIVRAIGCFFGVHEGKKLAGMKRCALIDASTYSNDFALGISALTVRYSKKRAQRLVSYFISSEIIINSKEDMILLFKDFLHPNGFNSREHAAVKQKINIWAEEIKMMGKGDSFFIPNQRLLLLEDFLDAKVKELI